MVSTRTASPISFFSVICPILTSTKHVNGLIHFNFSVTLGIVSVSELPRTFRVIGFLSWNLRCIVLASSSLLPTLALKKAASKLVGFKLVKVTGCAAWYYSKNSWHFELLLSVMYLAVFVSKDDV